MRRGALVASALLWACGQTARQADPRIDASADDGSSARLPPISNGGSAADAGEADGGTSAGGTTTGGTTTGGTATATGGVAPNSGSGGGLKGDAGAAGEGATVPDLCAVASLDGKDPLDQSDLISADYRQVIADDCQFSGLSCGVGDTARVNLANDLRYYGRALWHCEGKVTDVFGLVYTGRKVTQADGEALVGLYVTLTTRRLLLPDSYATALRNELLALLPGSVDPDAAPISICPAGDVCPTSGAGGGYAATPSGQAGAN